MPIRSAPNPNAFITPPLPDLFLVRITVVNSGTPDTYEFEEWHTTSTTSGLPGTTGPWEVKAGGRIGTSDNPGYAIPAADGTETTFAVDDFAWCRSAAGNAGLTWELVPIAAADSQTPWVHYRATASITISSPGSSSANFDGQTPAVGDRILLIQNGSANGVYIYNGAAVPMTRAPDYNTAAAITGATVFVINGTTWAGTYWACTTAPPITLGATSTTWAQTPGATATVSGYVTPSAQTWAGAKTFQSPIYVNTSANIGSYYTGSAGTGAITNFTATASSFYASSTKHTFSVEYVTGGTLTAQALYHYYQSYIGAAGGLSGTVMVGGSVWARTQYSGSAMPQGIVCHVEANNYGSDPTGSGASVWSYAALSPSQMSASGYVDSTYYYARSISLSAYSSGGISPSLTGELMLLLDSTNTIGYLQWSSGALYSRILSSDGYAVVSGTSVVRGVSGVTGGGDTVSGGIITALGSGPSSVAWGIITGTPTTLAGYGITDALKNSNNLSDLTNASTARTNLGLGSLATASSVDGGTP